MITDIVVNNKYVLLYDGNTLKSGTLTTGNVTTPFTAEPYDTIQEIIDRGLALGLTCNTEYLITSMEHGAILPTEHLNNMKSSLPFMDIGHQARMVGLGHATPDQIGAPPFVELPEQVPENAGPPK